MAEIQIHNQTEKLEVPTAALAWLFFDGYGIADGEVVRNEIGMSCITEFAFRLIL